jgi:hypothetical protein
MLKRYRHWLGEEARHMVETFDGEYVLYEDHLAVVAEKDREIERLKETTIDVWIKVPKEDSDGRIRM